MQKIIKSVKGDIVNLENKKPIISFYVSSDYDYKIYRKDASNNEVVIFDNNENLLSILQ